MEENKNDKFYVVMTDNSFRPDDKIKKIVYECDSMAEALKVKTHFLSPNYFII